MYHPGNKCMYVWDQYFWWSDPFLEFYRKTETGWQLAHRTEVHLVQQPPIYFP